MYRPVFLKRRFLHPIPPPSSSQALAKRLHCLRDFQRLLKARFVGTERFDVRHIKHCENSLNQWGADDRACWGEFVRRVEGRPPGKNAGPDIMLPTQTQNNALHYQNPTNGEDVHGQDPLLNSM
ncbi:hypothetical protein BYT27DRAFT_7251634 [Phlegmacium glaucopus]|nr:hypothetical protein BYT27DRAFT_7251634 [Phlegmacium glaucopus]